MIKNILSQNSFWIVNKGIAREIGLEAALLLSDLVTKSEYFEANNLLEDGYFFNTSENIEQDTTLTYHKQKTALKLLEGLGLIEISLVGVPAKLHFKIFENKILNFLNTGIQKSSILYNKNKPIRTKNKNKTSESKNSVETFFDINEPEKEKKKIPAKKKKTDPLFQPFRQTFEEYYKRITKAEYYWQVKDSVATNRLIQKIRHAYATAKNPVENPTEEQMLNGFRHILEKAANDKWICGNFETSIIDSKFNNLKSLNNGTRTEKDRELFGGIIEGIIAEHKLSSSDFAGTI